MKLSTATTTTITLLATLSSALPQQPQITQQPMMIVEVESEAPDPRLTQPLHTTALMAGEAWKLSMSESSRTQTESQMAVASPTAPGDSREKKTEETEKQQLEWEL